MVHADLTEVRVDRSLDFFRFCQGIVVQEMVLKKMVRKKFVFFEAFRAPCLESEERGHPLGQAEVGSPFDVFRVQEMMKRRNQFSQ